MTDQVTILRCGWCEKSFTYTPRETDKCVPGTRNQICDACAEMLWKEAELENERINAT